MRILMMTNTYTPLVGGLEKSIQTFSGQFRALGHEVKIVAPEFEKMPSGEKDVIRVPAIEKFVGTDFSLTLPLPGVVQELADQFKPDIVHSHHPFLMGDLALRLCGQNKIPLVFTYHTMFEYYTDHFGMDQQAVQQFVIELATGYANMADQVIVPSESVARVLEERKVTTPIAIVPTGIDVRRFAPAPSPVRKKRKIPPGAFLLGHTGRLAPEKNLLFLTEAAAEFLKQEKDAHFLVVGRGPAEREMRKIFRTWGVQKRVHFAGVLKSQALIDAYHAMDVFVFASKSETQGMVVTEAMAAGMPVVALDAPGVREVVQDKVNGRLLAEESRKKFSSALSWCVSRTPAQWNKIKKNAVETANTFSAEICAKKALQVYEKVCLRQDRFGPDQSSQWDALLGRFKTELGMMLNLGRAAGSALVKSAAAEDAPKSKITKIYQKKIDDARHSWMVGLKKIRRQIKDAPEETKARFESASEAVTQKIRAYETDLAELNRKVFASCEAFEKYIADAHSDIKNKLELKDDLSSAAPPEGAVAAAAVP